MNAIAIILGSALIGASIIGARMVDHYQLAAVLDSSGNAFMLRMNTRTGVIENCRWAKDAADEFDAVFGSAARIKCAEQLALPPP